MKIINKKQILATVLSVLVSVAAVATIVYATTSIGDDVSIGSTLTVAATSTLNGNVVLGNANTDVVTVYAPLVWAATTTTYGINLDAATFSTADILLQNSETIDNVTNGTITFKNDAGKSITITPSGGTLINVSAATAASSTNGILIGTSTGFNNGTVRSGIPVSTSNTPANGFYADDGGTTLTGYTEALNAGYLITKTISGDISASAFSGVLYLTASSTNTAGSGMSGVWGVTSIKTGVTVTNNSNSDNYGEIAGGHFSINLPSGATLASGSYLAGISIGGNLGGTHTGKVAAIRLRRPSAGSWDYGIDMSDATTTISTADIRLSNGETIDNKTDGTIQVLGGILKSGDTNGVVAAGGRTMVFGYYLSTSTALTGEAIGVKGDARVGVNSSGANSSVVGGYFKAANGPVGGGDQPGYDVKNIRGIYTEIFTNSPVSDTQTVTLARGVEINVGLSAVSSTVTTAYGIYLNVTTDSKGSSNGFTTGYGLWIQNEAVGNYGGAGQGQMLTAGIYLKGTSFSALKAFDYGIDMSAATMNTADIRLSSGVSIITGTAGPNGTVTAADGSLYIRAGAGNASTTLYVNVGGTTTWVAIW